METGEQETAIIIEPIEVPGVVSPPAPAPEDIPVEEEELVPA